MEPEARPSSIPPRRKRYAAITTLIVSVAGLIGAYSARIALTPAPEPKRPEMEERQPVDPPLGKTDPKPTTDDGVIAARVLQERANIELAALINRQRVSETRLCLLEQELRETRAVLLGIEAGKRAADARKEFRTATLGWTACFLELGAVEGRVSLREAADSAMRR